MAAPLRRICIYAYTLVVRLKMSLTSTVDSSSHTRLGLAVCYHTSEHFWAPVQNFWDASSQQIHHHLKTLGDFDGKYADDLRNQVTEMEKNLKMEKDSVFYLTRQLDSMRQENGILKNKIKILDAKIHLLEDKTTFRPSDESIAKKFNDTQILKEKEAAHVSILRLEYQNEAYKRSLALIEKSKQPAVIGNLDKRKQTMDFDTLNLAYQGIYDTLVLRIITHSRLIDVLVSYLKHSSNNILRTMSKPDIIKLIDNIDSTDWQTLKAS